MTLDVKIRKQVPAFQLDVAIHIDTPTLVLWGASGAGKTLTLNCLAGFSRPDSGRIVAGENLYFDAATHVHVAPQRRRCGYMFQDHALFPHMTVLENLRFAVSVAGRSSQTKIKQLIEAFELGPLADRKPAQLSGGQKQRAALARAMASQPALLLLDEPAQGLDARLKRSFFRLLKETRTRSEVLIVLVTHDLDECFELGGHLCLLENGKVIQQGSVDGVISKPASADVARSLGIYNVVPAEIEALDPGKNSGRLRMLGGSWDSLYYKGHLLGDKGFGLFRETAVKLLTSGGITFPVLSMTPHSHGQILGLGGLTALVTEQMARGIHVGDSVQIQVPPQDIVFVTK